jgi:hypothetical protein
MTDVATRGAREGEGGTTQHVVPWTDRALPWVVGLAALYPAGLVLRGAVARPADFLKNVLEGVSLGGVYALIALGYTMVYGVLGLINFAHSDVFMVGAYVGIFAAAFFGVVATSTEGASLPVVVACLAAAMAFCALLGVVLERFAYRPVRRAPKLTPPGHRHRRVDAAAKRRHPLVYRHAAGLSPHRAREPRRARGPSR